LRSITCRSRARTMDSPTPGRCIPGCGAVERRYGAALPAGMEGLRARGLVQRRSRRHGGQLHGPRPSIASGWLRGARASQTKPAPLPRGLYARRGSGRTGVMRKNHAAACSLPKQPDSDAATLADNVGAETAGESASKTQWS
jgi:hypothetical protein